MYSACAEHAGPRHDFKTVSYRYCGDAGAACCVAGAVCLKRLATETIAAGIATRDGAADTTGHHAGYA
jgi:hypothetical protein